MVIQVLRPSDSSASFSFWCCPLILMNVNLIESFISLSACTPVRLSVCILRAKRPQITQKGGTRRRPSTPGFSARAVFYKCGKKLCVIDTLGMAFSLFIWLPSKLLAVNLSARSPTAPDICSNAAIPSAHL